MTLAIARNAWQASTHNALGKIVLWMKKRTMGKSAKHSDAWQENLALFLWLVTLFLENKEATWFAFQALG